MYAIEFKTRIRNGIIEIPKEYREHLHRQLGEDVRAIVPGTERRAADLVEDSGDLIEELLTKPLEIPEFIPLRRDEAHGRA